MFSPEVEQVLDRSFDRLQQDLVLFGVEPTAARRYRLAFEESMRRILRRFATKEERQEEIAKLREELTRNPPPPREEAARLIPSP